MTSEAPRQRPEGKLIEEAVAADGRSIRQLAALAGMSDARWRQIMRGTQPLGGGRLQEAVARSEMLARMALVLRIAPDQLVAAGRADAAVVLERLHGEAAPTIAPSSHSAATHDAIEMIARSGMDPRHKLASIKRVLEIQEQADAETAAASGTAHDATVETRPPVNNGS